MRISDWSSDVCSSDLLHALFDVSQEIIRLRLVRKGIATIEASHYLCHQRRVADAAGKGADGDTGGGPRLCVIEFRDQPACRMHAHYTAIGGWQPGGSAAVRSDGNRQHARDRKSTRLNSSH